MLESSVSDPPCHQDAIVVMVVVVIVPIVVPAVVPTLTKSYIGNAPIYDIGTKILLLHEISHLDAQNIFSAENDCMMLQFPFFVFFTCFIFSYIVFWPCCGPLILT